MFIYPVVDTDINIEIRDEDLKIDVFRASGAGGQHVNKTSSAVRITHIPTGVVTASQQQRSQHKNKATAMKMLKNRLYQIELNKQLAKKAEMDANKSDVSFGSQIRSYVFQPYTMVNDHRTELKIPDVQKVMDGGIDPFIEAYLKELGGERTRERGVSDELNFVQRARREKLDALVAAGSRRLPTGSSARTRRRPPSLRCPRATDGGRRCGSPGGLVAWRGTRQDRVRASRRRRGRIQLYFRKDELGDERCAQLDLFDIGDVVGVAGPLMRTRTGEVTVRVADGRDARQVAASAAVSARRRSWTARRSATRDSPIRSSGTGSATRISPCTPRCARCSSRARGMITAMRALPGRAWLSSRSRRRCCSRCTAAPRRDRSRRTTTRSTCRSSCASRTSCISSA